MKKTTLFLMTISAALVLGGCKNGEKETEPVTTEAVTEAITETEPVTQPPTTEAPTEPERESSMDRTRALKGLVVSSGTDTLTIQTERGKVLEFSTAGADIQLANGIQTGGNVTVMYKGTIAGDDTSGVRVLMIVDLAAGETPVTEGEPMTEAEVADPNAGSGTIGGTITDLNVNRLVITADDGTDYYFLMAGTQVNLVNGFQKGNYVTVQYTGDIHGPDLVQADSVADNDPSMGDASVTAGPSAGGEYSYISGTLVDCGVGTTTITADDGTELTFDTTKATCCYTNGVVVGNYITLEYMGERNDSDTTGVMVTAVYDYTEDNAGDSTADASGTPDAEGAVSQTDAAPEAGAAPEDGAAADAGAAEPDVPSVDDGAVA